MFQIKLTGSHNGSIGDFDVLIEGCPNNGVKAVDFRRVNNLPEAPSNGINLKGYMFTDEAFCRAHADKLDDDANIDYRHAGEQKNFVCNAVSGQVYAQDVRYARNGSALYATPEAIEAYLDEQTPATAKGLLENVWGFEERSKAIAEAESVAYLAAKTEKQRKLDDARELCKDEIENWKGQAEQNAKDRNEARIQRDILAEFLSEVPEDALRGTLKAKAASAVTIDDLRTKVEDASPNFLIFGKDEEDEEDDDD